MKKHPKLVTWSINMAIVDMANEYERLIKSKVRIKIDHKVYTYLMDGINGICEHVHEVVEFSQIKQ